MELITIFTQVIIIQITFLITFFNYIFTLIEKNVL